MKHQLVNGLDLLLAVAFGICHERRNLTSVLGKAVSQPLLADGIRFCR